MSKVLSFHLFIETGWNRVLTGGLPGKDDLKAMDRADAVILPQGCRKELYLQARERCRHVFPDYEVRFRYPGKTGQARLFNELLATCPEQMVLEGTPDHFLDRIPYPYPFVLKGAWGGEGNSVILISNSGEFAVNRDRIGSWLENGGCLVQQYIPAGGRSLRVVVVGERFYPYWRINLRGGFYSNLSRGAVICSNSWKRLQSKAIEELHPFCRTTGINLAGFDFLFSAEEKDPRPLFLEINYCFRTRGLGGPDFFLRLLEKGVREWLAGLF